MIERFLGHKEQVVQTVKDAPVGSKPYELVHEWDEYEVVDNDGRRKTEQRNKRSFIRTITTDAYKKEEEVEKYEESNSKRKSAKLSKSLKKDE